MAAPLPPSPSFVSLAATNVSSSDSDDIPVSPKVRFDHECVLIPDPVPISRLPRFVTKSYSLPLWKRKRDPSLVSDTEEDLLDEHVVFKVPVPSIRIKTRSPSRDGASHQPLVSCLVQGSPTASPSLPTTRIGRPRRASLPPPMPSDAVTVPLRACCTQCYPSIDQCMKEGAHWEVHFSRGALRRRKSVSDTHTPSRMRHCLRDAMPGFDAIVAVDEVDRCRRSTDVDAIASFVVESTPAVGCVHVHTSPEPEELTPRRVLSHSDTIHPNLARSTPDVHHHRTFSPPIMEEDEHRPSPRRTPISSPLGSSTNLLSTILAVDKLSFDDSPPITRASPGVFTLSLDSTISPIQTHSTPPTSPAEETLPSPTTYFPVTYPEHGHERTFSDSPLSTPSSSPMIHARSPSVPMAMPRKKSFMQFPGDIFRVSTSVLKGFGGIGGVPMSA